MSERLTAGGLSMLAVLFVRTWPGLYDLEFIDGHCLIRCQDSKTPRPSLTQRIQTILFLFHIHVISHRGHKTRQDKTIQTTVKERLKLVYCASALAKSSKTDTMVNLRGAKRQPSKIVRWLR
ncbi:hypothetical protein F4677DRAFT_228728 [Hypoxylon crocopeplum]|nr:hypothetical protein F4677DRAFT_228728 [Hypoxylon crocopeplum]